MRSDIVNHKEKCKHENCELGFIWGKVRAVTWETASQITLRNCSKKVRGNKGDHILFILVKEGM